MPESVGWHLIAFSWTQGARRIVTEWPDLDLEARQFTSKILGENVSPVEKVVSSPAQPQVVEEELETKDELWSPNGVLTLL